MDGYARQFWHLAAPLFVLVPIAYFVIFYPLAVFRYLIAETALQMEWIVLGFIRVSRRQFGLKQVADVSTTSFLRCLWEGKGFHVFGNVFARRGVAIVLKKGVLWTSFGKTIYVTPRDPEAFVEQLSVALQSASKTAEEEAPTSG
jgi:hypothetical protein